MAKLHPIWHSFVLLCQSEFLTASEAIERLEGIYPSLPVRLIIQAGGQDLPLSQAMTRPMPELSQQQQGAATQQNQQSLSYRQGESQQTQQAPIDPNDFNAAIRAKAGFSGTTATLSRDDILTAGTGQMGKNDGQPGYDPNADFIRQGFAARDARRNG